MNRVKLMIVKGILNFKWYIKRLVEIDTLGLNPCWFIQIFKKKTGDIIIDNFLWLKIQKFSEWLGVTLLIFLMFGSISGIRLSWREIIESIIKKVE